MNYLRPFMRVLFLAVFFILIQSSSSEAAVAASVSSPFLYTFNSDGNLQESATSAESSSPYWWVNSGAYLRMSGGTGKTHQGILASSDPWRQLYNSANSLDTDNGTHSQNVFRLVSRSAWENVRVDAQFKINQDNFSKSSNRNASNGLLLMSRYGNSGQTLYYAGIRVDGAAIIKKKKNGVYTTLATKQLYPGTYIQGGTVNLLPHSSWIALRSETITNSDGSVSIRLYVKNPSESIYSKVLEVKDTSSPILGSGFMGIRTDFMDVEFENLRAEKI